MIILLHVRSRTSCNHIDHPLTMVVSTRKTRVVIMACAARCETCACLDQQASRKTSACPYGSVWSYHHNSSSPSRDAGSQTPSSL